MIIKFIRSIFNARKEAQALRSALNRTLEHFGLNPYAVPSSHLIPLVDSLVNADPEPVTTVEIAGDAITITYSRPVGKITYSRVNELSTFKLSGPVHSLEHHRNLVDTFHNTAKRILDLHAR